MHDNKPEHETELVNQPSSTLLVAREEIEFLRTLLESQKLAINSLESKLVEVNQELEIKSDELGQKLMTGVSFDEAKAIAKQLSQSEKVGSLLVAGLFNIIYNLSEPATDLLEAELSLEINKDENKFSNKITAQSKKIIQYSQELNYQYQELVCRFLAFSAHLMKIKQQYNSSLPRKNKTC